MGTSVNLCHRRGYGGGDKVMTPMSSHCTYSISCLYSCFTVEEMGLRKFEQPTRQRQLQVPFHLQLPIYQALL